MNDRRPVSALDGISVVDFSNVRTGAQISQTLADFGADVVHIEPPGGSPLRAEAAWPFWARGKRSLELDLKAPEDLELARELAARADVVIETFRPGVADRLGIGYAELSRRNPRLVYASVSGFGETGPYAQVQGYDGVILAKLGFPWAMADAARRPGPAFASAAFASYPASQLALHGILGALYEREDSGLGQRITTSTLQGQTVYDTFNWFSRILAQRFEEGFSQSMRTQDGVPMGGHAFRLIVGMARDGRWLQFSQTTPRLFKAMMELFGLAPMLDDPKWKDLPDVDDLALRREFWELLLNTIRSKTVAEWVEEFDRHPNVWGEMYRDGAELLDHPQMIWNKMVAERDDPLLGRIRMPGPIAHLYATPAQIDRPAPARGEHEAQIRAELAANGQPQSPPDAVCASGDGAPGRPPFAGTTVVELGTYYAAPFAATVMAEMGARVIKLEELEGDPHRAMLPFPEIAGIKVLQGKESVAVDLKSAEGRAIAHRIIAGADVVLQSFRGGVAEKLGLDPVTIRGINPDIVYLNSPGYGVDGPYSRRPAFAPTIGAGAGFASRNLGGNLPCDPDMPLDEIKPTTLQLFSAGSGAGNCDGLSAVTSATAICLGLLARKRGCGGQDMLTSMLSSAAHAVSEVLCVYDGAPTVPSVDPEGYGLDALYRLYEAGDGEWVFLACPTERDWSRLTAALEDGAALAEDPRFAESAARKSNDGALAERLAATFRNDTAAQWEQRLLAAGVACVTVWKGPPEANFIDEGSFGRASGFVTEGWHPLLEDLPRLAPLVTFSRSASVVGNAGLLGTETEAVLLDYGYSADEIDDLHKRGVILKA